VGHGSKEGWDVFGPERKVTKSEGNVLYELDGKPALSLYKQYLGEKAEGLPASGLLFPLALRQPGEKEKVLVRTLLAVDAANLADGRFLIVVGDVTGHGISSAIITGAAKAACDLAMSLHRNGLKCEDLLKLMNAAIHGAARQRLLMSCVAAIIDPRSGTLWLANAGHAFPYLVREQAGMYEVTPLIAHGAPLGANQDSVYTTVQAQLRPNDVLVWYTSPWSWRA